MAAPTLFPTFDLPGKGKTTEARRLEVGQYALRLSNREVLVARARTRYPGRDW